MESQHLVAEQRTLSVNAILRNSATNSYNGCRIYIPSANIPMQDPDFITFDTVQICFSNQNAWRYVVRSNITNGDIFYSFLGVSTGGGGQPFIGLTPQVGPQALNILVKPTKPITYIEMVVNGITPIATSINDFTEMLPSGAFTEGIGLWTMHLTMTFYKMKK